LTFLISIISGFCLGSTKMSTISLQAAARTFVRNTTNLRKESDISIADMAAATKLSISTLKRIEKYARLGALAGNYRPTLATVVKIANVAQVTPDELLQLELEVA
jgi:transcriptional regulator with XRE-family HTH domain